MIFLFLCAISLMAQTTNTSIRLWTRQELAELLQVDISTIDRWIAKREMDSVLFGRIRRVPDTALQDWMARRLQPAADNERKPGRKRSAA
jgi:excisionase family DNA binding protein